MATDERARPELRRVGFVIAALVLAGAACSSSSSSDDQGSESASTAGPTTTGVATSSEACEEDVGRPSLDRLEVTVDGTARSSLVHLPQRWDGNEALPVVMSFHGATSNASTQQLMDGFDAEADSGQFVVLRPEGLVVDISEKVPDVSGWDVSADQVDEPAFVAALLDELGGRVCVDPSRVFATGFSVGGEMAMAAACALPDRIAAFASVGAARSVPCAVGVPTPMIAFHGTSDLVVPYEGSVKAGIPPTDDLMSEQAERNGCADQSDTTQVTPSVEIVTWTGCDEATVLYRLADHGHSWPGTPLPFSTEIVASTLRDPDGSPNAVAAAAGLTAEQMAENVLLTNTDVNATDQMWEFFVTHG